MADFDLAVAETLTKLQTILEHGAGVQARLTTAYTELADNNTHLDSDTAALSQDATTLLNTFDTQRTALVAEAETIRQALQQLGARLQTLHEQVDHERQEAHTAISAFSERVTTLQHTLATTIQHASTALAALRQRVDATDAALQDTITQAEAYLQSDVHQALQAQQGNIEQHTAALQAYVAQDVLPQLTDKATAFATHLTEVMARLTTRVQAVQGATHDVAQESMHVVSEVHNEYVSNLLKTAETLSDALERLRHVIDTTSSDVVSTKDVLVDGANATNVGLKTALGILEEVQELLSGV
jgi:chromosome segregation ATPase